MNTDSATKGSSTVTNFVMPIEHKIVDEYTYRSVIIHMLTIYKKIFKSVILNQFSVTHGTKCSFWPFDKRRVNGF